MKLFVGLGNPGSKYARNRHNIGFMAVDEIAKTHGFSPWRSKFQAELADGTLGGQKVILVKPQTFMNRSGQSVGEIMRFYKLDAPDITVFHDEIDLAPSKIRLKDGGGHAGHNGLRSIHDHIGPHYSRVRIGVGHPGHKDRVPGYVLHDFPAAELDGWVADMVWGIGDGAPHLAVDEGPRFLNAVSLRVAPPRSSGKSKTAKADKSAAPPSDAKETDEKPAAPSALQSLIDKFR